MARYDKFNFMFFIMTKYTHQMALYDAASLKNFRVMIPCVVNDDIAFIPQRFPNNPAAFSNPATYSEWSEHFFDNDFPVKKPICFVFYEYFYTKLKPFNFFAYLRANYPGCKLVLWIDNPMHEVKSARKMFLDDADTKEILSTFDCVLTYNQIDAKNYGLTYFEGPYSMFPFKQTKPVTDIFFVGQAKDRLEKILRAYESFTAQGFVCDFYIADDITSLRLPKIEGLHFGRYLPYPEVLEKILRARAVLDISQRGTYGLTSRYFESLAYNKNFITDNAFYRQERFNSPKLFFIDKSLELDKEQFMSAAKLSSNYRNEYSPLRMIAFLEILLSS